LFLHLTLVSGASVETSAPILYDINLWQRVAHQLLGAILFLLPQARGQPVPSLHLAAR